MSTASVYISGAVPFSTGTVSDVIQATLIYMPFIDEDTFQLLTGAGADDPYWTISRESLSRALNHWDTEVNEGDITITATGPSVVMILPLNGEFAFIRFDAEQMRNFAISMAGTPFVIWEDGRSVRGVIVPCTV